MGGGEGWTVADFPDPIPGFPPSPRPGIGMPAAFTVLCLLAMPAGVSALIHFSKTGQRAIAAAGLVVALAGFVGFLYWVNRLRNRWAWRVGRIVPARVATARYTDVGAVGLKVGLKSLGLGFLAGGVDDHSMPVTVQYLCGGVIYYEPVRGQGATLRWRMDDAVWVILHRGVLPLVLCAPASYRNQLVPDEMTRDLQQAIRHWPHAS